MSESTVPVLIAGSWRESRAAGTFQADNPTLGEALPEKYPVSSREEVLEAIQAGSEAAEALRTT
ncbi:MAG: aldehyde dehydrogenase (NADP(+)), partial [Actinomycetota bacterium]